MQADLDRRKERAFRFLIRVVKVTMLMTWLPLIRGLLDGGTYQWGLEYYGYQLGGIGTGGDYHFLVIINAIGLGVLYSAYKSSVRATFYLLTAVWLGPFFYLFVKAVADGNLILYGDTLGIAINLAYIALPFIILTITSLFMLIRYEVILKLKPAIYLWNRFHLVLLTSIIPAQFLLLRFDIYGITDPIGVLLTIAQCLLLSKAFKRV